MQFLEEDRVKVNLTIKDFYFGNFSGKEEGEVNLPNYEKFFKKNEGIIIEKEYHKRLKKWTYFVEFKQDDTKRYWFIEDELILI